MVGVGARVRKALSDPYGSAERPAGGGAPPSKPPLRTWPPAPSLAPSPKRGASHPRLGRGARCWPAGPTLPTVALEPHHVDILALALIAVGIFLGGVSYLDWAGGTLGDGAVRATGSCSAPWATRCPSSSCWPGCSPSCASGARRRGRCAPGWPLVAALTLMLAAGTLGIGPGAAPAGPVLARGGLRAPRRSRGAGRVLGHVAPALHARRRHPRGVPVRRRAHPRQRRHPGHVVRATGAGMVGTGRAVRRSTDSFSSTLSRRPRPPRPAHALGNTVTGATRWPVRPTACSTPTCSTPTSCPSRCCHPSRTPRSSSSAPPTSRPRPTTAAPATTIPAPPLFDPDGAGGEGDIEASDERPEPEPAARRRAPGTPRRRPRRPHAAGPLPRGRSPTTPTFEWQLPSTRFLARSTGRGGQARHRRAGADRPHAARDPRPLRDRGQGHRPRHRPAHHPL